ncbi:hypothetical protein FF1_009556 [Malus domestica]
MLPSYDSQPIHLVVGASSPSSSFDAMPKSWRRRTCFFWELQKPTFDYAPTIGFFADLWHQARRGQVMAFPYQRPPFTLFQE